MNARPQPLADDVAALLRGAMDLLPVELRLLDDGVVSGHPGPAEWCVKECLGHIIEVEDHGFTGMISGIRASDGFVQLPWDPDAVHAARRDCEAELDTLLDEFARRRRGAIALLQSLTADENARQGTHNWRGAVTIGGLLASWVNHERMHFRQILATVDSVSAGITCDVGAPPATPPGSTARPAAPVGSVG